jgi:hypothetical protein
LIPVIELRNVYRTPTLSVVGVRFCRLQNHFRSGQLYIAIIIALLVGKYAGAGREESEV